MSWQDRAMEAIQRSLGSVPHELNELDWKNGLTPDKEQIRKHLSAFANSPGGGFLVFGVNRKGELVGYNDRKETAEAITTLGNIARDGIEPSVVLSHTILPVKGVQLLFFRIPESPDKPVHLRGKGYEHSYIRSNGESRKMSKQELAHSLMNSRGQSFEFSEAQVCDSLDDARRILDIEALYKLLGRPLPKTSESLMEDLKSQKILCGADGRLAITNLGILTCAKNFSECPGHEGRGVRVITYPGMDKLTTTTETTGRKGYAIGFSGMLKHIMRQLPGSEVIKDALRQEVRVYPEIAVREILANAVTHQDLTLSGLSPMVEIFSDRMEITNAGKLIPSLIVDRMIDTHESRNEGLARFMRQLGICEERGSGIDKAIAAIELFNMPPIEFRETENSFKVTLYAPRKYKNMTQDERIRACYQHCTLRWVGNQKMTNSSLRERLGISESNYPMVSRIIKDTIEIGKIKKVDETSGNKSAAYIPAWA